MNESTVNNPILKENESTRAILAGVDTGEYDAEVTELMNTVIGFLADENLNNVPGVNMWVAANAWEFFSTAGQKMAIGAMDVDGFIAELDAAVAKDVEECGTKATFTY